MATIYFIAGPPGVGKSTSGTLFTPKELDVLNQDDTRMKYKAQGYIDYKEHSMYRVRDMTRQNLINSVDFALELNLGYTHQYDYAKSKSGTNSSSNFRMVLSYSNCLICSLLSFLFSSYTLKKTASVSFL